MEIQNHTEQGSKGGFESHVETEQTIRLTSAELANLWAAYMNSSLKKSFVQYFLAKVEDKDIRPVLEYALHIAESTFKQFQKYIGMKSITPPRDLPVRM
jgi:hypothetical protein